MSKLNFMLCAASVAGFTGTPGTAQEVADRIFIGGPILTMEEAPATAEALAIKDGLILAVGSQTDIMAHKGDATAVTDLEGKALLPGFIDSHTHYFNALSLGDQVKLYPHPAGPGDDVESIVGAIRSFIDEKGIKPGELVTGYGYDDSVMPDSRLLNRDDLDAAFPDNPVRIDHVSMHGAVLNSPALDKFGIGEETETPPGGIIVRKPGTNEPWGLIMETAFLPVFEQTPPMTPEQEIEATRKAHAMYAENGITTAQEGATHLSQLQTIARAAAAGANAIDVVAYPFITDLEAILAEYPREQWGTYHKGFKIGGVKISIDGSPQGRTAAFTTPYLTGGPSGEENWTGALFAPQEAINAALKSVYDLDVPVLFHANGDAAIDALITAHEIAAAGSLDKARSITAIHAQFTRPDQIGKYVEYGIRPSYFTLHTYYFAGAHIANRGPEQAAYISPMRDSIDAGLRPTNHTDAPVVPLDQMFMLWTSVNRLSRDGEVIGADQRITPLEGLKSMTLWAAEQYGEDQSKGSLAPGKRADLVVLDADPTAIDPMKIRDIKVVETLKDGKTIHLLQ